MKAKKAEYASMRFTINGPINWSDTKTGKGVEFAQSILDRHAKEIATELDLAGGDFELRYGK